MSESIKMLQSHTAKPHSLTNSGASRAITLISIKAASRHGGSSDIYLSHIDLTEYSAKRRKAVHSLVEEKQIWTHSNGKTLGSVKSRKPENVLSSSLLE